MGNKLKRNTLIIFATLAGSMVAMTGKANAMNLAPRLAASLVKENGIEKIICKVTDYNGIKSVTVQGKELTDEDFIVTEGKNNYSRTFALTEEGEYKIVVLDGTRSEKDGVDGNGNKVSVEIDTPKKLTETISIIKSKNGNLKVDRAPRVTVSGKVTAEGEKGKTEGQDM